MRLPLTAIPTFLTGLREALDRGAADAVRSIQERRRAGRRAEDRRLQATLQAYVENSSTVGGERAMTDRLADITARIGGIRQLGAVVNAMRGIAAARAQQARSQLVAVDSYAKTIALAIGRTLAYLPPVDPPAGPASDPTGAGDVLRGARFRRRVQRARSRLRSWRSGNLRIVPDRNARPRGDRGEGNRRRLGERDAVAFAGRPQTRRSHRRGSLRAASPLGRSTPSTSFSADGARAPARM